MHVHIDDLANSWFVTKIKYEKKNYAKFYMFWDFHSPDL